MMSRALEGVLFWFPAFVFSTTLHEAAHAWVAMRSGDRTAYHGGQVSLSPWPHIRREPLGMLVVPLVTSIMNGWAMGWASAPYDRAWADRHPRKVALMSAAGPAANLVLALVAIAILRVGLAAGVFVAPPGGAQQWSGLVVPSAALASNAWVAFAARGACVLASLNILLGVFNLLPLPPLDGSAVIGLVLPAPLTRAIQYLGPAASVLGLFAAWKLFPYLIGPISEALTRLLGI